MSISKVSLQVLKRGNIAVFVIALISVLMFRSEWHFKNPSKAVTEIIASRGSKAFTDWQRPRGGEYVLPVEVRIMLHFLRKVDANSYRFSKGINDDWIIQQRLVEGAYPLRVTDDARYYLYKEKEILPQGCRPIMHRRGVALAYCP